MSRSCSDSPTWLRGRGVGPRALLVVFLVLLACYRFTLIGSGHFFWSDERVYLWSMQFVEDVVEGEYRSAAGRLFFQESARPGHVLVSTIPVVVQRLAAGVSGERADAAHLFDIASGFNVLVTLGITVCLYVLGRRWTRQPWYGLAIAVVGSLLCQSNVWIRHMTPYTMSLLWFLGGLCVVSRVDDPAARPVRTAVAGGLLSAAGYACYPGYYALVIIHVVVLAVLSRHRAVSLAAFGAASLSVPVLLEAVARCGGTSYLGNMAVRSGTITQGLFAEGYVFAWRYLRDVEGAIGIALFVLFVICLIVVLPRRGARIVPVARVTLAAAVGCYLLHATMGVVFHRMVFYGRLLGMYVPFLVGGAVLALAQLPRAGWRRAGVAGLVVVSLCSFAGFAADYRRVVYPADFLQETMRASGRRITYPPNVLWGLVSRGDSATVEAFDPEVMMVTDAQPDAQRVFVRLASHQAAARTRPRFIAVNFKYLNYIRQRPNRFKPPAGYVLAAEAVHPEAFRALGYEGRKPWERRRLRSGSWRMRLYRRVDPEPVTAAGSTS